MAFTMRVHQRDAKDPANFTKIIPYMRFTKKGETPIFLQNGKFYWENGKHINDMTGENSWAFEGAEALSVKAKKEVDYTSEIKKRGRPAKKADTTIDASSTDTIAGAENGDD